MFHTPKRINTSLYDSRARLETSNQSYAIIIEDVLETVLSRSSKTVAAAICRGIRHINPRIGVTSTTRTLVRAIYNSHLCFPREYEIKTNRASASPPLDLQPWRRGWPCLIVSTSNERERKRRKRNGRKREKISVPGLDYKSYRGVYQSGIFVRKYWSPSSLSLSGNKRNRGRGEKRNGRKEKKTIENSDPGLPTGALTDPWRLKPKRTSREKPLPSLPW